MSSFAALMALSATQTRESQDAVQATLLARKRKEAVELKAREEQERKQREVDKVMRLQHFENERKQREREELLEKEKAAKEREMQRREEELRDALRYGPKKAKALSSNGSPHWPSSGSDARQQVRKRRVPSDDEDGSAAPALTREEKRRRKAEAEMRRAYGSSTRTSKSSGYRKSGKRLPGGAVDITAASTVVLDPSSGEHAKDFFAHAPLGLTKLNPVKRDRRTVDEIWTDLKSGKELNGDEAKTFSDWFGTTGKKGASKNPVRLVSASAPGSGANTPASSQSSSTKPSAILGAPGSLMKEMRFSAPHATASSSQTKTSSSLPSVSFSKSSSSTSAHSKLTPMVSRSEPKAARSSTPKASSSKSAIKSSSLATPTSSAANGRSSASTIRERRPRSPSLSDSPPPKRQPHPARSSSQADISNEIWKLFGKKKSDYVQRDVISDDEDMEADAKALEREELRSARIAKKEEEQALEEERRHEEEKRRKKAMKDKRGY